MLRRLIHRTGVLAAAAVCVLATAATASPVQAAAPAPATPGPLPVSAKAGQASASAASTAPVDPTMQRQAALLPAAQSLANQARSASSDIAGVRIDPAAGVLHVYRTNTSRPLGAAASLPAGMRVVVHPARFNRATMVAAAQRVMRDARALGGQHVSVQSVGPLVDGSGIGVTVLTSGPAGSDTATAASALRARYGSVVATVTGTSQEAARSAPFFAGFRFNDFAPWFGGDRLATSSVFCTTGFAAVFNGGPVMLTAAHCGGVGTANFNGPRSDGSFSSIGSTVYSNAASDIAAISVTSFTTFINTGAAESPSQRNIPSWGSPVAGQLACQSGSFEGEVCLLEVVDSGQFECTSSFLGICLSFLGPLADAVNIFGPGFYAAGHGDSGGPVYVPNSDGTGTAIGLVHGPLTPNAANSFPAWAPVDLSCPAPEGASVRCSAGFSFADMPGF